MRHSGQKYLARTEETPDIEVIRTESNYVISRGGKRYTDFFMGWCVGNQGWGNALLRDCIKNYDGPDYVYPGYDYKPWTKLAQLLADIAPGNLCKSFRVTGGTEAVEFALQAAIAHTGRKKFVSINGCYHGDSIATLQLTSDETKRWQITPPLNEDAAEKVEKLLKTKEVAAFIMEPMICNLNVLIPEIDFMARVQELCKKYGTLFIVDEVATGFGRTGKLFASEHFSLEPDVMCLGKAITGGYAGMGAMIATEKVAKSLLKNSGSSSTYGWHPLSTEVALTNINYLVKHREAILEHVDEMGRYFFDRLSHMHFGVPTEIRGQGLAIGVEFKRGHLGIEIVENARQRGLLLSESDEKSFTLFPALNIDRRTAAVGLDILESCSEIRAAMAA
jgi:acetylornithine/succinyldiaminopimelate/putrescine aminotransferase